MEEYIRVTGRTVEDALLEASITLGTTRENIEYRVIEHESKGFLGIGAKKAVIEARTKTSDEDFISEIFKNKPEKETKPEKKNKAENKENKDNKEKKENKGSKKEEKAFVKNEKKEAKAADKKEKKDKPAEKKKDKPTAKKDKAEKPEKAEKMEIKETKKEAAPAPVKEEKAPKAPADPEEAARKAVGFLTDLLEAMGVDGKVTAAYEDNTLNVNIEGGDMGLLIGKRGQTLDSVQYLTSLVVNKGKSAYVRVRVDTEDYRERRKATLENLAKNMAFKVKKTRRSAFLEPMNPYERRIIHAALQDDPYVTTHSEGEEPFRKVVVTLKKREDTDWSEPEQTEEETF